MAIVNVPTIRDLGTVPNNNMDEAAFNQAAETFTQTMPGWGGDVKAVGEATKTNAEHAGAILVLVEKAQQLTELARDTAMGVANFKGDWVTLSGPMARPATVQHNNSVWLLMRDVANVAAEVPGTSTAWVNQTARVASVNGQGGDVVVNWGNLPGKPTSVEASGILDAVKTSNFNWSNLGGKPSTTSGFGIVNGVTTDTEQDVSGHKRFQKNAAFGTTTTHPATVAPGVATVQIGDHAYLQLLTGMLHICSACAWGPTGEWVVTKANVPGAVVVFTGASFDFYRVDSRTTAGAASTPQKMGSMNLATSNLTMAGNVTAFGAP